jgi:hypothetical protein
LKGCWTTRGPGATLLTRVILVHMKIFPKNMNWIPLYEPNLPDSLGSTRLWSFLKKLNFSGALAIDWLIHLLFYILIKTLASEKKILKDFSKIDTCKNVFPYCGPSQPQGTMILGWATIGKVILHECILENNLLQNQSANFNQILCKSSLVKGI